MVEEQDQMSKKDFIAHLFTKFEEACQTKESLEFWYARELQRILGYTEWRNFK
jgi:DNA-damage-inducible protein D